MELLFELLLTAAATLLVALLLAKLFAAAANADQPRHDRPPVVGPAAAVIAKEEPEEERIIEVDEVKAAPALSEGWVEVEKAAPAPEGKEAAWVAVEEGVPAALAPELFLGTVLEERKEEGEVGKKPSDLTLAPAAAAATEAAGKDLGDEAAAAPREILGSELEEDRTQQHDSGAGVAPIQVPDGAELQKQQVQPTEAAVVEQRHLVTEAESPAQVIGAGLAGVQDAEAIPQELGSETVPGEVPDIVLQNQQQEEKVIEVDERELAAEVAPREVPHEVARELVSEVASRAIPDKVARELTAEVAAKEVPDKVARELTAEVAAKEVPGEVVRELAAEVAARAIPDEVARESASVVAPRAAPDVVAMDEELKEKSAEEVVHQHEEVQTKEEAQCEANPVDQQAKPAPKEELAVPKADDLNVSQEGSSNDKAAVQLPQKEAALPGTPEDEVEFEEWEGIERSEVEKRFGAAAAFAASDAGAAALSKLDSDVQLQLQGLLKVAVDGPCYDSAQPLTLRPSSRAKWVSWQKLGNMHPEIAMGKYMDLLSEVIPRWMGDKTSSTKRHEGDVDSEGAAERMTGHTSDPQAFRGNEGSTSIDEGTLTSPPNPEKGKSCDIPAE